ncbi:MAG: phage terminase small subunit P27 family [Chloroflexi bacterium]|nr:phage terminase small subunit P27 family [Chloroflexota bacterium]
MGERGPVPTGYARRRNKRHTTGQFVTVARPPMPRTLPAEAKAEWHRVVPELESIGILASIDRGVLIRYCVAWADWCELARLLERSGKLIKGQKGNLVRNPLWLMKRDAEQAIAELARQLGLTPAARLRAGVVHERPADPEDESKRIAVMEEYKRALGWEANA